MTRKNTWLPGGTRGTDEPGSANDGRLRQATSGSTPTPLTDIILASIFIILAALLSYSMFVLSGPVTLAAVLFGGIASLVLVGMAVYLLQNGLRRWRWRRRNIALTGGRYLRPWQRTPTRY